MLTVSIHDLLKVTSQGQGQGHKMKKVCFKNQNFEADLTSPLDWP